MDLRLSNNKRGSLFLVNIMLAVLIFISIVVFIEPIFDQADTARTDLSCGADNLSTGTEMTCIVADIAPFGFIGVGFGAAIALLFAKKYGREEE